MSEHTDSWWLEVGETTAILRDHMRTAETMETSRTRKKNGWPTMRWERRLDDMATGAQLPLMGQLHRMPDEGYEMQVFMLASLMEASQQIGLDAAMSLFRRNRVRYMEKTLEPAGPGHGRVKGDWMRRLDEIGVTGDWVFEWMALQMALPAAVDAAKAKLSIAWEASEEGKKEALLDQMLA